MKQCKGECKKNKEICEFGTHKSTKDGLRPKCKDCVKLYNQKYAKRNKEKIAKRNKDHYKNNKERILKKSNEYYDNNKEKIGKRFKEYHIKNIEDIHQKNKEYRKNNKEKLSKIGKIYRATRKEVKKKYDKEYRKTKKNDCLYRLPRNLRSRLHSAIKNNYKSGSAVKDLGCSIQELKVHLEEQFQPGMTWDNWSHNGWHIDHIKPLASFDLAKREQLLEACNYNNLQPLWAKDNQKKSNKLY